MGILTRAPEAISGSTKYRSRLESTGESTQVTANISEARALAVESMFRRGLESLVSGKPRDWIDMWDDAGTIEFPFAPEGYPQRLSGKANIAAYMNSLPDHLQFFEFPCVRFHHTTHDVTVVEFSCNGKAVATGRPYRQKYVAVIELTQEGRISVYRDYWNPLVAVNALGRAPGTGHDREDDTA